MAPFFHTVRPENRQLASFWQRQGLNRWKYFFTARYRRMKMFWHGRMKMLWKVKKFWYLYLFMNVSISIGGWKCFRKTFHQQLPFSIYPPLNLFPINLSPTWQVDNPRLSGSIGIILKENIKNGFSKFRYDAWPLILRCCCLHIFCPRFPLAMQSNCCLGRS